MSNRSTLKSFFSTGLRPTQAQFADFIDSAVSLAESNAGNITLNGGVIVGNAGVPAVAGAIRWNAPNFEFHNGVGFQVLNFAGPAITNPLNIGNVTIGSNLLATMSVFAHFSRYSLTDFGIAQNAGGTTIVNSPAVGSIQLRNSPGFVALTASNGNVNIPNQLLIGSQGVLPPIPAGALLAVSGDAVKSVGGQTWTIWSDIRLKKDVVEFKEGLEQLIQVKPIRFRYKQPEGALQDSREEVGVLAHEVREIFPYMVTEIERSMPGKEATTENMLAFNGSALQYVMINAIKELNSRLEKIEQLLSKDQN